MKRALCWAALCLLFVSAVIAAGNNKNNNNINNDDDEEDNTPPCRDYDEFKVEQLVSHLVQDNENQAQELSVSHRNKIIKAVARYLSNSNDLGNLKKPEGHRKFETAWAKMKALCYQIRGIYERGITPKHLRENGVWESLIKVVQYIINNKMLLPDEVYAYLCGGRRSG